MTYYYILVKHVRDAEFQFTPFVMEELFAEARIPKWYPRIEALGPLAIDYIIEICRQEEGSGQLPIDRSIVFMG